MYPQKTAEGLPQKEKGRARPETTQRQTDTIHFLDYIEFDTKNYKWFMALLIANLLFELILYLWLLIAQ